MEPPLGRVFISYRREDSAAWTGRIYDRVVARFGRGKVFLDVEAISPGEDFVKAISNILDLVDSVVVVIGPDWSGARADGGQRRLDDPSDYVRQEIAGALERDLLVIPVLVEGAPMPSERDLPGDIRPLAFRNAVTVDETHFASDVDGLIDAISRDVPGVGRHNLPSRLAPLVGRERELAELSEIVDATRLITLVGAGGSGKTTLALELARDLVSAFPDGVWFADLSVTEGVNEVPGAVSAAIRFREQPGVPIVDQLLRRLEATRTLLVLDNCEHVISGVADLVREVLARTDEAHVLATSREPLELTGERRYPVPTLRVPKEGHNDYRAIEQSPAVELFVERARAADPGFELTSGNAEAIAAVCRRLDGLPLALELAAGRLNVLTPADLMSRIDTHLEILVSSSRDRPSRQQTLTATLDWSFELLDRREQDLFSRLSVFRGGFSLQAVESVCAENHPSHSPIVDVLGGLVDKSLVHDSFGPTGRRFRLLETVKSYAAHILEARDDVGWWRDRHADYFAHLADKEQNRLGHPGEQRALERLEADHDNLRAAHDRSLSSDPESSARIGSALCWFWLNVGHHEEARDRITRSLAASSGTPSAWRAELLASLAYLEALSGNLDQARHHVDNLGMEIDAVDDDGARGLYYERLGEILWAEGRRGEAVAAFERARQHLLAAGGRELMPVYLNLGITSVALGRTDRARQIAQELEGLDERLSSTHVRALADEIRGRAAFYEGTLREAQDLHALAAQRFGSLGLRHNEAVSKSNAGRAALYLCDFEAAHRDLEDAVNMHTDLGDELNRSRSLTELARLAVAEGRRDDALALLQSCLEFVVPAEFTTEIALNAIVAGELAISRADSGWGTALIEGALKVLDDSDAVVPEPMARRLTNALALHGQSTGDSPAPGRPARVVPRDLTGLIDAVQAYVAVARR